MVFGDKTSPLTIAFAHYVAPCPHINQIAGQATFAYGSQRLARVHGACDVHRRGRRVFARKPVEKPAEAPQDPKQG